MRISKFIIDNIKCFEHVELELPGSNKEPGSWIVLLGGNGMGKSTLLQSMAISTIGQFAGQRLLPDPSGWTREGVDHGTFLAEIVPSEHDKSAGRPRKKPYNVEFIVTGNDRFLIDNYYVDTPQILLTGDNGLCKGLMGGPYAAKNSGWFACGYGPFRRLMGGSSEESRLMYHPGRESRFVTLFREAAALSLCLEWLSGLVTTSLDPNFLEPDRNRARRVLDASMQLIDALLPGRRTRIDKVDTKQVHFHSIGGAKVSLLDLSDGFRSFLALVIDILRHLEDSTDDFASLLDESDGETRILAEGVVFIDEVDAHLHPTWQRELGFLLSRTFPRIQFIVTSHSPFVAQAASDGGLIVLRPSGGHQCVEADRPLDSVKGWRVDQILTSPLFGLDGTRDELTESLIRRHSELVAKRQWSKLPKSKKQELIRLEERLGDRLTAPGETLDEQRRQAAMEDYVDQVLNRAKQPQ